MPNASPFGSCALAVGFCHGCLLFGNSRTLGCHLCVQFFVRSPFGWKIVFVEDRSHWAFRNARFAVNAFIWMDEENGFPFIKTFYWTNDHAICVFAVEAWFCDDVSH
jgi:hypothetical protein